MSSFEDVDTVRSLARSEIDKLKNAQLRQALVTLINESRSDEPSNTVLLDEIRDMKKILNEVTTLKHEVTKLSEKVDDAYKIIHQQQMFLETLDNRDRRRNLVITGVSENADENGATDVEKVQKVLEAAGYSDPVDPARWTVKRLGQQNERNKRPIHIAVDDQKQRDNILRCAKNLKNASDYMSRVYIKKDVHPAIRKETARLRKREQEEKDRPENVGVNITYDWKNRVLLRDGVVIDRFVPRFF